MFSKHVFNIKRITIFKAKVITIKFKIISVRLGIINNKWCAY